MNQYANDLAELVAGLSAPAKRISPKFFYDERGSALFDAITRLPEYYPTNTEIGIMRDNIEEIVAAVGPNASLIEFGSGSSYKTRILLEHLESLAAYVPVDISEDHLLDAASKVRAEFPHIEVAPVVADFTRPFNLPQPARMPIRNVVYFPGSTIGNFEHDDVNSLLKVMRLEAKDEGALLIGVDLQKDPAIIHDAYNDSVGITAQFNLNILHHLNHAFGADFDTNRFEHDAHYDVEEGRIVMRLISTRNQHATLGGQEFQITEGEAILTEYSHKYTLEGFARMAEQSGFEVARVWTDAEALFSVQYLVAV